MLALPHLSGAECVDALRRLGFEPQRSGRGLVTMRSARGAVIVPEACTLGPALVAAIVRAAGIEPLDFLHALAGAPQVPAPSPSAPALA